MPSGADWVASLDPWPEEFGPAPMTSCSAMTSASMLRMTSAMREELVRPSSPRQRWML